MRYLVSVIAAGGVAMALAGGPARRADGPPTCGAAERASAADDTVLRDVAQAWKDAYNGGDAARVASLYAEDGQYLSAHVGARGREAIRAYVQRGIDAGGHIEAVTVLESGSDGTLGWATGTYAASNAGQEADGRIVLVLRKCGEGWLIVAHQVVVRDQPWGPERR